MFACHTHTHTQANWVPTYKTSFDTLEKKPPSYRNATRSTCISRIARGIIIPKLVTAELANGTPVCARARAHTQLVFSRRTYDFSKPQLYTRSRTIYTTTFLWCRLYADRCTGVRGIGWPCLRLRGCAKSSGERAEIARRTMVARERSGREEKYRGALWGVSVGHAAWIRGEPRFFCVLHVWRVCAAGTIDESSLIHKMSLTDDCVYCDWTRVSKVVSLSMTLPIFQIYRNVSFILV